MKRIALIIPYFGKFPNYFPLFLNSCRHNPTIDWLLVTDIAEGFDYPENVHVIPMTFPELIARFQEQFDFEIALKTPYKLCDYKPAYGYLFREWLTDYDFWGHCDMDLLFGDLRTFFPDAFLEQYDKIGHLGHLTLYRNCEEVNTAFMAAFDGRQRYREVLSEDRIFVFDEWDDLSINRIFLKLGLRVCLWNDFFDAHPNRDNLVRVTREIGPGPDYSDAPHIESRGSWITWEQGRVFAWPHGRDAAERIELAYAHFQKRAMEVRCAHNEQQLLCLPDGFEPYQGEIPRKHLRWARQHRCLDRKRLNQWYLKARYWMIVKTAPVRHGFRRPTK